LSFRENIPSLIGALFTRLSLPKDGALILAVTASEEVRTFLLLVLAFYSALLSVFSLSQQSITYNPLPPGLRPAPLEVKESSLFCPFHRFERGAASPHFSLRD